MKSSGRLCLVLIIFILSSCGTGANSQFDVSPSIGSDPLQGLEQRTYQTTDSGQQAVLLKPVIQSPDDLTAYRNLKIAEAQAILDATKEQSKDKPYYPVVITMWRPVSLTELNQLIRSYNPSTSPEVTKLLYQHVKALPKTEIVKDVDKLVIDQVKFVSTTGSGQLSYETLTDQVALAELEAKLSAKEMELNAVTDFQLIAGITSIKGGIHRDQLMQLENEPQVYLADIGPKELYDGSVVGAKWNDVYKEVNQYTTK
jgi:hypothetical protein